MQLLLIAGTILVPLVMFVLHRRRIAVLFDLLAALSVFAANISAGLAVLAIKQQNTEFTTHIHQVFIDPLFLAATGYVGLYSAYRLLVATAHAWTQKNGRSS